MKALLVIDLQNDYFDHGTFPLWEANACRDRIITAIGQAQQAEIPVVHIQHIADPEMGLAPFFNEGTEGAAIHADILAAAPEAPVVVKHFADSFEQTNLTAVLEQLDVTELCVCGMMTQNCVTHTAISKVAENYQAVHILLIVAPQ